MPTEFVRIRDTNTLAESSVPRRRAAQLAGRGVADVLDVPAVNALGEPLPSTSVQSEAPADSTPVDPTSTAQGDTPAGSSPTDPAPSTSARAATGAKSKEQAR